MSIFKGHLKIIVLKILAEKDMYGYELCNKIKEETGWKPSFGSIYPLLNSLRKEKIVAIKEEGKKKEYSLTKKGEELLNDLCKRKDEFIGRMDEAVKSFEVVFGKRMSKDILSHIHEMKKNKMPPILFQPEIIELKKNIFRIISLNNKEKTKKLKRILIDANRKVSKLV